MCAVAWPIGRPVDSVRPPGKVDADQLADVACGAVDLDEEILCVGDLYAGRDLVDD